MSRLTPAVVVLLLACGSPQGQMMPGGGGGSSSAGGQGGGGGGTTGTGGGTSSAGGGSGTGGSTATGGGTGTGGGTSSTLTTIRVHYPAGAKTMWLRGEAAPLSWFDNTAMTKGANDTWEATVDVPMATFEFKPMLDDAWSKGPNYRAQRGSTVDIYPRFNTDNGRVTKLINAFHSNNLMRDRGVWAYLPASYDENTTARYPVLYMHDGQNLFDPAIAFSGEWKVDETLNQAAQDGSIREIIVIGVENTSDRIWEYTGGPPPTYGGDLYRTLLIDELKPVVDSMLRTMPGRATTGVAGSSMGGHISAYLTATRPDVFGLTGNFSTTVFIANKRLLTYVSAITNRSKVYMDVGTDNDGKSGSDELYTTYTSVGYVDGADLKYVVQQGANHSEFYWAQRLPGALQWLFGPRQ